VVSADLGNIDRACRRAARHELGDRDRIHLHRLALEHPEQSIRSLQTKCARAPP
jgi:hypothetical protein